MFKPQKTINNKYDRIIALIDMECFYCQVEEQLNPHLKGKPIIVQPLQYDDYGGGGIIALNYVARSRGVKRSMRGDEAKQQCPDLELVRVPVIRGKADLSKYRNACKQVAAVLQTFTPLMCRASVDEAYLDLTERVQSRLSEMNQGKYALKTAAFINSFAVGYNCISEYVQHVTDKVTQLVKDTEEDYEELSIEDQESFRMSDIKLLIASSIVTEIRNAVKEQTGYECSAGIAHNKILAKLVCGMNKPNKQTILPLRQISHLYRTLPIKKVQRLGGKFGEKLCADLGIQYMSELLQFSKEQLQRRCDEKQADWLYNLAHGIDLEAVTPLLVAKSFSCSKMFPRQNAIADLPTLKHWLREIATDVVERIEQDELENNRRPTQMVVSFTQNINNVDVPCSRKMLITSIDEEQIVDDAIDLIKKNTTKFLKSDSSLNNCVKFLGFNVCKFDSLTKKSEKTIADMFRTSSSKSNNRTNENDINECDDSNDEQALKNTAETFHEVNQEDETDLSDGESEPNANNGENSFRPNDSLIEAANQMNQNLLNNFFGSPDKSVSTKPNYLETYAEFHQAPALNLPKIQCTQCKEMILAHDMQIHTDAHLAFQLNQDQRSEFRNSLKRSHTSRTPVKKKLKIDSIKKVGTSSIEKFLFKRRECTPEPSTSSAHNVDVEKCSECGNDIPVIDFFEHMDFHAAKRLQDEFMRSDVRTNQIQNNSNKKNSNNNISSNKIKKNSKNPAVRNITGFFTN